MLLAVASSFFMTTDRVVPFLTILEFLDTLEHTFQEKQSLSQNSILHYEFSRTFLTLFKPAILPAGPLLLDCQC